MLSLDNENKLAKSIKSEVDQPLTRLELKSHI